MRLVIFFSAVPKFLPIGLRDQLISLKSKFFYFVISLNSVQGISEYKFHELCQFQRSAEARSNALLAILNFQQLFQSGDLICVNFFLLKWKNKSDVIGNIKMCA